MRTTARRFNAVKVFSATKAVDRAQLGETVTTWLASHSGIAISDLVIRQSSDAQFHCVSITLFYLQR